MRDTPRWGVLDIHIGLYRNDDPLPAAAGHFVHVYVDRKSKRRCRPRTARGPCWRAWCDEPRRHMHIHFLLP
jgi:hypothetical protein